MKNLLTLEAVMLVNGLAIQHSSEWEDYLEMNAQIHGLTKEEYAAYYLGTQWQMQCMESLKRLTEKKVTRKQLDKAINDVAKITNDLKKVVKEWAAARDAGKTEEQAKKLEELKKLNDEKTAAQKVVDSHIQQLDKNVELETSESMNEDLSKKTGYREVLKLDILKKDGLHTFFKGPGMKLDTVNFSWEEEGDEATIVFRNNASPKVVKDFKAAVGRSKSVAIKESVNEAVSRSTKIYCVATPAPRKQLVEELENIFGDDYRNIVTEFTDDEGYESVLLFNLTRNDIALIQKRVADVLIWEYSIKKGKEIMESVNEEVDMDMVNTEYGFWGTMDQYEDFDSIEIAYEDAMNYLMGSFKFTEEGAYNFLNSKWGRKLVDEYYDGGHYNMVDTIDAFGNKSTWKKYAKQFNESKTTMKNLKTLENFNEAAPKMGNSAETNNLLNLRDQVANAQKGGSEGRYGRDFEKAKTKALRAIEQMITYTKIGV